MDTSADARFDRLTRLATRFYGADVAFIGLVDASHQWMKSMSTAGLAQAVERPRTVCNLIIESGRSLVVGDLKTDPRFVGHPLIPHLDLRFYAGAPLLAAEGLAIGSFCIMARTAGDEATFDIGPLEEFAAIAMDEIELWRLGEAFKVRAEQDALTRLANRRRFDEALDRALRRTARTGAPVSLLLLDVDRFKAFNDLAGHPAGDRALARLGDVLETVARRPDDTAARYGGEEFALILPDTGGDGALAMAERIRARLREAEIAHPAGGLLTVSIGIATAGGPGASAEAMLQDADGALYAAKHAGRNAVRHAGPVPAGPAPG
ncbi:sensor domain-containing diguanylate cyclase [Xanthobacter tagetidis]|nr:sensor domain-containing diguanylate cyclase [Xanthobacter tagetidis]MBB6309694.1 diguanylate cyclase (GGDEF)-like protein [Xanthobacter tagetidis]